MFCKHLKANGIEQLKKTIVVGKPKFYAKT